jgi:hypothetical protein
MRPKFVLLVLSVFVVMAAVVVLRPAKQPLQSQTAAPPVAVAAPAAPVNVPALPLPAPVAVKPAPPTPEEHQAMIDAEKDQLYTWSMSGDPANLPKILADLNSPEKEIVMAAIEAAKQFGDTNAIPVLKAAAAKTDDSQEAMAMLQAADFIALPEVPLTAFNGTQVPQTPQQAQEQAKSKADAETRRQAYEQARAQRIAQMQGQQPGAAPAPAPSPSAGN